MFVQVIQGRVSDKDKVREVLERWTTELGPTAKGWLGSTGGVTDDGRLIALVRFESALCRDRHNADYAEVRVMPMSTSAPLVLAVIDLLRSA